MKTKLVNRYSLGQEFAFEIDIHGAVTFLENPTFLSKEHAQELHDALASALNWAEEQRKNDPPRI